jgi:RNA polymerase sigma-70 factor (ECF subfamily)
VTDPSSGREHSEDTLVERAAAGDMAAFEELVMRNADRLFAALRRFGLDDAEAQEVAQETFLRAWRSIPRFGRRSQFFTWLYRIGFNEAQRRLARRPAAGVTSSADEQSLYALPDQRPGPAEQVEVQELLTAVERALRELPVDLRAPVVLRDIEGFSTRDAASMLDLGEPAFKSRLHRGRMALRGVLTPWIATSDL